MRAVFSLILLGFLFLSSPALAALAIDSQESGGTAHNSTTSPLSWSFTNTAGTLLVVGVVITGNGTPTISGVTWNGTSMNPVSGASGTWCTVGGANTSGVYFYYLEGATTGAHTISVTFSYAGSPLDALGAAISFTGENSGGPVANGAFNTQNATLCSAYSTSASVTVNSTTSGDYVLEVGGAGSSWSGAT